MSERVWMTHPHLTEGRWMPRTSVPFHGDAGWIESEPPPEPEPELEDKPATKKVVAKKRATPRRPSDQKDED